MQEEDKDKQYLIELGERFRLARRRAKLTQGRLGEILEVTPNTIGRWETGSGSPSVTACRTLARLSGRSIQWIVTGTESAALPKGLDEQTARFVALFIQAPADMRLDAVSRLVPGGQGG